MATSSNVYGRRRRAACAGAILALAAIGCQAPTEPLHLVAIELGTAVDETGRITTPTRTFASDTLVHASIKTQGTGEGTLRVVWGGPGGILSEEKRAIDADGPTFTVFRFAPGGGWQPGRNRVGFALNDDQLRTAEFEVQ